MKSQNEAKPSVLIVCAHPDDEVLGAGATAALLTSTGHRVRSCILSGDVEARQHRPDLATLRANACAANALLGMDEPIFGPFPNIAFNTVPHLELVQFVEKAILDTQATVVITHHPADLNDDHLHTSRACQAASRLWQRREGLHPLETLLFMEVASSTDWSFPGTLPSFQAVTYVPVTGHMVDLKNQALACYEGVMRPAPHPRRDEILRGMAAWRGAQAGVPYAEAFQTAFRRWNVGVPGRES